MSTPTMDVLNVLSTETRQEKARIRSALQLGKLTIAEVLRDPPPCIQRTSVLELLRLIRRHNSKVGVAWEVALGRRALMDGVNLLVRVEDASQRTLAWAIENAPKPYPVRKPIAA